MSRRRGWSYHLMAPVRWLSELFRLVVQVPFYETLRFFEQLGHSLTSGTGAKSWLGILSYYVFWLPLTIWYLVVSLSRAAMGAFASWPSTMRLRDLATGLPALIVAVPVIFALTALRKDRNELTSMYIEGRNKAYAAAETKDAEVRRSELELALFYARSLARIDPEDRLYLYHLALIYIASGDNDRGLKMMEELAPRDTTGFGPAHLWMAKEEMKRKPFNYKVAAAHLERSLVGERVDKNEVYRELGLLHYQSYLAALNSDSKTESKVGPLGYTAAYSLKSAGDYFKLYQGDDPTATVAYGVVLQAQGMQGQADEEMKNLIGSLEKKVALNPDHVPTRLNLARALYIVKRFDDAKNVLQVGRNKTPSIELDRMLSEVHVKHAEYNRQNLPGSAGLAFGELQQAYELDPGNHSIVLRYLQGLSSNRPADAAAVLKSLEELSDKTRKRAMTKFLLAYEAEVRGLPRLAEQYAAEARAANDLEAPALIGEIATVALARQNKTLFTDSVRKILASAGRIWPTHPDLLYAQAYDELQLRKNSSMARTLLLSAVEAKKKDVTLTVRIASDELLYGDLEAACKNLSLGFEAEKYKRLAQSARTVKTSLKSLD